jgi:hypothetical protein
VAAASDNLHDNGIIKAFAKYLTTEYETLAVGEWVKSRQADAEDGAEARYITSNGARSPVVIS